MLRLEYCMRSIDLNCDMGEGMGNDSELMDFVSSVNIACGFHAGDVTLMRKTAETALAKGVAIGAHPGYADLEGFGRNEMNLSSEEIFDIVVHQVTALKGICETIGTRLHHVKPHGALYNSAAVNPEKARVIAEAVNTVDPTLILYGLSGSYLISEAKNIRLKTASEVFADRTYQADGTLTPRSQPGSLLEKVADSVSQALEMTLEGKVSALSGETVPLKADTICIHGDGAHALEFARAIHEGLIAQQIEIKAV